MTIDGAAIAGLPAAPVPLDEVRARLLDPATPAGVRDGVWAYVIRRARVDGPSWTVAAAGLAMPMLAGLARLQCARFEGDPSDIRAELVAGFVAALGAVDPDRHPLSSLRWAAYRSGHAALLEALDAPRPVAPHTLTDDTAPDYTGLDGTDLDDADTENSGGGGRRLGRRESCPPPASPGHPDLVLAQAVADGVLTVAEASLIGSTRLEKVTVAEAAAALGTGANTAWSRRYRAEARLLAHLSDSGPGARDETGRPSTHTAADQPAADRAAVRTRTEGSRRRRHRGRRTRPGGAVPSVAATAASPTTAAQTAAQTAARPSPGPGAPTRGGCGREAVAR